MDLTCSPGSTSSSPGAQDCAVCLTEVSTADRGFLDVCDHVFCFECIEQWSKVTNLCPICRQRFHEVRRGDPSAAGLPRSAGKATRTRRRGSVITVKNKEQRVRWEETGLYEAERSAAGASGRIPRSRGVVYLEDDESYDEAPVVVAPSGRSRYGRIVRAPERLLPQSETSSSGAHQGASSRAQGSSSGAHPASASALVVLSSDSECDENYVAQPRSRRRARSARSRTTTARTPSTREQGGRARRASRRAPKRTKTAIKPSTKAAWLRHPTTGRWSKARKFATAGSTTEDILAAAEAEVAANESAASVAVSAEGRVSRSHEHGPAQTTADQLVQRLEEFTRKIAQDGLAQWDGDVLVVDPARGDTTGELSVRERHECACTDGVWLQKRASPQKAEVVSDGEPDMTPTDQRTLWERMAAEFGSEFALENINVARGGSDCTAKATSDSAELFEVDGLGCPQCTFLNIAGSVSCEMCETLLVKADKLNRDKTKSSSKITSRKCNTAIRRQAATTPRDVTNTSSR